MVDKHLLTNPGLIPDFSDTITDASLEEVLFLSTQLLERNREAYEVLADDIFTSENC